jgi:hypothetical protein
MAAPSPRHLERATGSELADDSGTRYRSLAPRRDRSGPVETKARGWTAGRASSTSGASSPLGYRLWAERALQTRRQSQRRRRPG